MAGVVVEYTVFAVDQTLGGVTLEECSLHLAVEATREDPQLLRHELGEFACGVQCGKRLPGLTNQQHTSRTRDAAREHFVCTREKYFVWVIIAQSEQSVFKTKNEIK